MMERIDRVKGCILGLAVGDALGYPIEFQRTPPFTVSDMTSPLYSDDTQMSIATAQGLINGTPPGEWLTGVYEAYQQWLLSQNDRRQRRSPGSTCLSALASGEMGSILHPINNSKGCGGVMRVAPVGLVFTPESAFQVGAECAAITHGHPSGYLSAGFLSALISYLTEGVALSQALDASTKILTGWDGNAETLLKIEEARREANDHASAESDIAALGGGWVGEEALAIAVYCSIRFCRDFETGVLAAVNHGGDSDSTGCITGAVLGALLGIQAIRSKWVREVENSRMLHRLAEQLSALPRKTISTTGRHT